MNIFLEIFVSVYFWSVSILLPVSLFCLLFSTTLPKENILNVTMSVFVKTMGVQEAWSLGVIWLNTVVFLWILVNKHSVNISSNGNTQLIFIPPANFVCGGVYCFHVVRASVHPSVCNVLFF